MDPLAHHPAAADDFGESAIVDYRIARLETYLDGELDAAEAARVREELAADPACAALVARLSDARRQRIDSVGSFDADDDAVVERLCREARRMTTKAALTPPAVGRGVWWYGSAAAACVALGFGLGLLGGYDFGTTPANPVGNPVPGDRNPLLVSDDGDGTPDRPQEAVDVRRDGEPAR